MLIVWISVSFSSLFKDLPSCLFLGIILLLISYSYSYLTTYTLLFPSWTCENLTRLSWKSWSFKIHQFGKAWLWWNTRQNNTRRKGLFISFHDFRRSQSISVVQAWLLETLRCMLEGCIALAFTLQQTGKWRWQVGSGYRLHRFTPTDSLLLTRLHLLQCVQSSEGLHKLWTRLSKCEPGREQSGFQPH